MFGIVLCLYYVDGNELGGWCQVVCVYVCQGVDSEGICESLCFFDVRGCCVWCLYLLFDSDFLVWDWLVVVLLLGLKYDSDGSVGECLWWCLVGYFGGQCW